jgi:predicted patatin/cPLA2 family phospholipase
MSGRIWCERHPVTEVLRRRRETGSKPGQRDDPHKVGLAIEGGGMRGVVSGGMLVALEELGYADAFDDVYSCSSGALNGAYFVARDTWYPLSIYFDDLSSGHFLDFARALRRQMPMNLDYVLDEVLTNRKPLDYVTATTSAQRLHIMVTDVDALKTVDLIDFESAADLRAALRASAWLPVVTTGTSSVRGMRCVDGAVLRRHPFRTARADGCTHVLSLSTKPIGQAPERATVANRVAARFLERLQPGLGRGFLDAVQTYVNEDVPYLRRSRLAPDGDVALLDLAPLPRTPEVRRHETNFGVLVQAARAAYRTLYQALEGKDVQVVPRLTVRTDT